MSKVYKNNSSGVPGVCFDTHANKWRAYITFNNKKIRLGNFSFFQEAVDARLAAENSFSIVDKILGSDSSSSSGFSRSYPLISALGGDENFIFDKYKLIALSVSYLLKSVDKSHSFLIYAINNWHSFSLISNDITLIKILILFFESHAGKDFFLYISGLSFLTVASLLSNSASSCRRSVVLFAQKLKNKFDILL